MVLVKEVLVKVSRARVVRVVVLVVSSRAFRVAAQGLEDLVLAVVQGSVVRAVARPVVGSAVLVLVVVSAGSSSIATSRGSIMGLVVQVLVVQVLVLVVVSVVRVAGVSSSRGSMVSVVLAVVPGSGAVRLGVVRRVLARRVAGQGAGAARRSLVVMERRRWSE
jgi:hypothetical protein